MFATVCNMEAIFHEKQEGSLCAQHCLNALLQGSYFTPVDLATLAQQMDDEERLRMSESGVDSEDYRRFLEQPSGNYDDSGYFSVQVISSALEVWGLELVPYNSTEDRAVQAQRNPAEMQAFICNYRDHWFTIRHLGYQWFNLNSLLTGPELVTDTYLVMFLAQLQQEGYSIFVVFGDLPECEADGLLRLTPAVQTQKPRLITITTHKVETSSEKELQKALHMSLGNSEKVAASPSDEELQRALRLSLGQPEQSAASVTSAGADPELQKALHLSLGQTDSEPGEDLQRSLGLSLGQATDDEEFQRALRLSATDVPVAPRAGPIMPSDSDEQLQQALQLSLQNDGYIDSEHADLEKAMRMSLECCEPGYVDREEVRRRRLAYLTGRHDHLALPCLVPAGLRPGTRT